MSSGVRDQCDYKPPALQNVQKTRTQADEGKLRAYIDVRVRVSCVRAKGRSSSSQLRPRTRLSGFKALYFRGCGEPSFPHLCT